MTKSSSQHESTLPETILQFGSGKFLRAFVDFFIHEANLEGQNIGRVVVVQTTGRDRADYINNQQGKFHLLVRGFQQGKSVDEKMTIESISRALHAGTDWAHILEVAQKDSIKYIISNTSEVGYNLCESDSIHDSPPVSFPAKLLQTLFARFKGTRAPVIIIPCELIDNNAHVLKQKIVDLAQTWTLDVDFIRWLQDEVIWLSTLVDRITIDPPADHPLFIDDPLLTITEPFAFFALENHPEGEVFFNHPALVRTDSVIPFALRKVRILNGAHTALVCRALPLGIKTVREAVEHVDVGPWIREVLFSEIIPALPDMVESPGQFAEDCIDRFLNPFLDHNLEAIAFEHTTKVKIRLIPSYEAYTKKFNRSPPLLQDILSPLIK